MRRMLSKYQSMKSGQSLVETALFLPILVFMLAGIVEVSNLLITQNRVTTSSRMAAGFGASNYDRENWAVDQTGTAYDMGVVALNTVTETMDLDANLWDIWSIRAQTNGDGTALSEYESTHVYGTNAVVSTTEWDVKEVEIQQSILEALQSACPDAPQNCASNLEVVASVPFHNIDTILGLNIWQWTGLQRIQGLTVMRVRPIVEAAGCPILPITVRLEQYSIYPSNWEGGALWYPDPGDDPVALFPNVGEFQIPDSDEAPTYINLGTEPNVVSSNPDFIRNKPGIRLWQAIENDPAFRGTLYWARDLGTSGNFGWLSWRGEEDQTTLANSLEFPGNFIDPDPNDGDDVGYAGGPSDTNTTNDPPPITGDYDGQLEFHEWITNGPGNVNSDKVKEYLEGYVRDKTWVTLIVFDADNGKTGSNVEFRVYSFITVILHGFSFQDNDRWVLFEFISAGVNCGLPDLS